MECRYYLMFEDHDLEPIDYYEVFETQREALAAFDDVVANPPPEIGSVYVTEVRDDDAVIIIGAVRQPISGHPGRRQNSTPL